MKKYIVKILLFFVLVAIVDVAIGFIGPALRNQAKGGGTAKVNHICFDATEDVLMFGSSRMLHSFVPDVFADTLNATVYNCGAGGNGIILMYGQLEMILHSQHKPKLIVYDAFSFDMYTDDNVKYIEGLRPYANVKEIKEVLCDVDPKEGVKCLSNMYRYNSKLIRMTMDAVLPYTQTQKGYIPLYGTLAYEPEAAKSDPPKPVVDSLKLKYVEKFIDLAKANDIQVVFTASPRYGNAADDYFEPITTICEDKVVPFLDYFISTDFSSRRNLFEDPVHMNDEGARLFSAQVAHRIKNEIINL